VIQPISQGSERSRPRLSIVVLPFTNLSDDREQQYFADGVTEDLTADLSRLENMFVISRNTAFTYRNKLVDTKQIGSELGVRYVLEGSVRRSDSRVRITAQLIDAATDAHLWIARFDRDTGDLFALQNEITSQLANALGAELIAVEAARPTDDPDARDYILRGRAATLKPTSRDSYAEMISLFERALALDPQSVEAQARLASALANRALIGVTGSAAADITYAGGLVDRALAASPRYAPAHFAKGNVLRAQGRCEEAIPEFETVLSSDRNAVAVLDALADCKLLTGSIEEVIPLEEEAIRLSPRDPGIGWWYLRIGQVRLLQSRMDEAIPWLEKARSVVPELPFVHALLASAYGLKGETERAAAELAEAQRLTGDDHFSNSARLKAFGDARGYYRAKNIDFEATYFAGLRKAGMPEE
jgi:TolB-like protein